jgi:glucose-6-phosphate 1-dehydrogenase
MSSDLAFLRGTGDLVWRQHTPALSQAFGHGPVPEGRRIIGVARDGCSWNEEY